MLVKGNMESKKFIVSDLNISVFRKLLKNKIHKNIWNVSSLKSKAMSLGDGVS